MRARAFLALLLPALIVVFAAPRASALRVKEEQVILDKLDDYDQCQQHDYSGDWCNDALKRWVEAHPADAFKAGKMTRLHMNHWAAIPFFAQAFAAKKGVCKDEDVKLAVISAVDLPASNAKVIEQAKNIAFKQCFNELKDDLVKAASMDSYTFKNICKDLLAKGALSGMKKAKCEKGEG